MEDLKISLITLKEKEISFCFSKIDFVINISSLLGCLWANPVEVCVLFVCFLFFFFLIIIFFFRVGKSLACHSPGKW